MNENLISFPLSHTPQQLFLRPRNTLSLFLFFYLYSAISTSFTQQERLEAIQKTREAFQHDVTSLHDDEIATGADAVLVKHLTFLICHAKHMVKTNVVTSSSTTSRNNNNSTMNNNTNTNNNNTNNNATSVAELVLTLESLEGLYRASTAMVGASFARMGPELLYLLTLLVQEEVDGRVAQLQQQQANNNTTVVVQQQQQQPASSSADGGGQQHAQHVSSWAMLPNVMGGQQQLLQGDDMNDAVDMDLDRPSLLSSSSSTTLTATMARPVTAAVIVGTPEGDEILRKAMRLFGHFARVGDATRTIAHFPGLLRALVNLVRLRPFECVPWEARLSALWTLANLACNTENMTMMVCQATTTPSLVAALVEVSCRPLHPGDSVEMTMEVLRSRSIASRAILNLSWAPENKIILADMPPSSSTASSSLSSSSSSSAPLIDLLSELAVHRAAPLHRSRTVREILTTTRCHAVGALRNLAAAPRRTKIALCEYRNGHVLDILTDAALNDPDQAVKDRAFAAIHNLAIYDTAERIVNHPALVLALKDVLLSADEDEEDGAGHRRHEEGTTPKSHAQATILVLERSITPDMKAYENLRELLQVINPTPNSDPEQDSRNNNNNNNNSSSSSNDDDDDDDDDMGAIEATAV
jgi:hypothetical protein